MKKITLLLFLLLSGCAIDLTPSYTSTASNVQTIDRNYDAVWSKLVDFLANEGIAIKILDKESGLMVSEIYSFKNSYTRVGKEGNLENPAAYVVIGNLKGGFGNRLEPHRIDGNFNVRVKRVGEGQTEITVNLVNLISTYQNPPNVGGGVINIGIKTTGSFEQKILNYLK